jgi:hypothetical protein
MKNIGKLVFVVAAVIFFGCSNKNTAKIETALCRQLEKYPESRLQDIYKNFYQDCFGTGHAISDTAMIVNYLKNELENTVSKPNAPMIDTIGWRHNFVRVNIDLVRQGKISTENLAKAFAVSASKINAKDTANWLNEWQTITQIIENNNLPVKDYAQDKTMIDSILHINNKAAMHHSVAFNEHYNPHYRVVEKSVFEKMLFNGQK